MVRIQAATMAVKGVFDRVLQSVAESAKEVRPYTAWSDEELVTAVQGGDQDAFGHIINRYQGKIFAYIMRLMNHADDATDITQDVFMKAYKHMHTVDTSRKFSSWLYRIAHNESVNWLKKKTRAKVESLDAHLEAGHQVAAKVDVAEDFARAEEQKNIRAAIDQLPEKYRDVMERRYLKQQSYHEISNALGKPVNTVGTLINRAKKQMEALLQ